MRSFLYRATRKDLSEQVTFEEPRKKKGPNCVKNLRTTSEVVGIEKSCGLGYRVRCRQGLGRECRDAGGAGEEGPVELRLIGHGREVRFYLSVIPTQFKGKGFGEVTDLINIVKNDLDHSVGFMEGHYWKLESLSGSCGSHPAEPLCWFGPE